MSHDAYSKKVVLSSGTNYIHRGAREYQRRLCVGRIVSAKKNEAQHYLVKHALTRMVHAHRLLNHRGTSP